MSTYQLSHLSDRSLLCELKALVARDRETTAELLAHIAEVDARKLYLPAAYPSMYAYCVGELHMSEDASCRRIRAARAARQFPAIRAALADGQLHLSAVVMLAPYLTPENADELLAAAAHQNKSGIEQLLAQRFPQPELPTSLEEIGSALPTPVRVEPSAPARIEPSAPGRIEESARRARVAPLAPERFALQVTIGRSTNDKLRYAQALLSHAVPSGDVAQVLDRALDALIGQLEKRKFAATTKPRPRQHPTARERHIPAHVKRTVWQRDGGQCTFVSDTGRRCPARTRLEFDHIDPVARGGEASVAGVRLHCRAHNQYAAECTFGTEFMRHKRWAAAEARAAAKLRAAAKARERAAAAEQARERDVVPWLRALGFRADEARRAAARCEDIPNAPLEERVRLALSYWRPPHRRVEKSLVPAT